MSMFRHSLGNAKLAILSLLLSLVLSVLLNILLGFLLYRVPTQMTVFVPPHISNQGWVGKANQINDQQVYQFAYSIWTALNSWSGNGQTAYVNNLKKNAPYLTTPFKNELKKEMASMQKQGFLYHHAQISYGVDGASFDPADVKYVGNGTWLVHLNIRTINYVMGEKENDGFGAAHVASDAETSFIFKVTKFPVIKNYNTSGLVLAGFAVSPKVVKVYQ